MKGRSRGGKLRVVDFGGNGRSERSGIAKRKRRCGMGITKSHLNIFISGIRALGEGDESEGIGINENSSVIGEIAVVGSFDRLVVAHVFTARH